MQYHKNIKRHHKKHHALPQKKHHIPSQKHHVEKRKQREESLRNLPTQQKRHSTLATHFTELQMPFAKLKQKKGEIATTFEYLKKLLLLRPFQNTKSFLTDFRN